VVDSNLVGQAVVSIGGNTWGEAARNFVTGPVDPGVPLVDPRGAPNPSAGVWRRGAAPVVTGPAEVEIGATGSWQVAATHPKTSSLRLVVDFPPLLVAPEVFDVQSGESVTLNRSFPAAGDFAVRAFTTDVYGVASDVTTFPFSVVVPNQNPVAVAKIDGGDTATKLTFLAFEFNGSQSSDPDPGDQIVNWTWNFGDASPLAYGPVVTHNYTDHGLPPANGGCRGFLATLTVRDDTGAVGTDTVTACPVNRPAAIPALPDLLALAGKTITLDGSGIFDPEGHQVDVTWTIEAAPNTNTNNGPLIGVLTGETPPPFTPGGRIH
jgi:hypothetical protein